MPNHTAGWLVGWFLGWIVCSFAVAVFAANRGRNSGGWILVALLTSPLIAFVILLATPDLAAQQREREESARASDRAREVESRLVQGADIALRFEKLRQLHDKELLSPVEYAARKQKVLNDIAGKRLTESGEEFLGLLIPLIEGNALTSDEVVRLKAFAFQDPGRSKASAAQARSSKDEATRPCPNCGRLIHPKATTCMHCWTKVAIES